MCIIRLTKATTLQKSHTCILVCLSIYLLVFPCNHFVSRDQVQIWPIGLSQTKAIGPVRGIRTKSSNKKPTTAMAYKVSLYTSFCKTRRSKNVQEETYPIGEKHGGGFTDFRQGGKHESE